MRERLTRYQPLSAWLETLGIDPAPGIFHDLRTRDSGPRYNIAPGTQTWIATLDTHGELILDERRWAFQTARGETGIVRSEAINKVAAYRKAGYRHRCVVLANGYYQPESAETETSRSWLYYRPRDDSPLFLGAIAREKGFAILTRPAIRPLADTHERSPILIPAKNVMAWLDPGITGIEALQRFAPQSLDKQLGGWRVGDGIEQAGSEGPTLIMARG